MALGWNNGYGIEDNAVRALIYAADMGARVSNNSWTKGGDSRIMEDAIIYEHDKGMVTVFSAGNSNSDIHNSFPKAFDGPLIVAATQYAKPTDIRSNWSNWGEKIDVAAPGADILSLNSSGIGDGNKNSYIVFSGTSMAAPHVAGLAALILSKYPNLTNEEVRQIIRLGADDLGNTGKDLYYGFGRINARNSMLIAGQPVLAPIIMSPRSRAPIAGHNFPIIGSIPGKNFKSYTLEIGAGWAPSDWQTVSLRHPTTQPIQGILGTLDLTTIELGPHIIRLTAIDANNRRYLYQVQDIQKINDVTASVSVPPIITNENSLPVTGSAFAQNGKTFVSYTLEWADETTYPQVFSTTGISLNHNGTQSVNNGLLGTWDTSGLEPNHTYILRLSVKTKENVLAQDIVYTTIPLQAPTNLSLSGEQTCSLETFSWTGVNGAEGYLLAINTSPGSQNPTPTPRIIRRPPTPTSTIEHVESMRTEPKSIDAILTYCVPGTGVGGTRISKTVEYDAAKPFAWTVASANRDCSLLGGVAREDRVHVCRPHPPTPTGPAPTMIPDVASSIPVWVEMAPTDDPFRSRYDVQATYVADDPSTSPGGGTCFHFPAYDGSHHGYCQGLQNGKTYTIAVWINESSSTTPSLRQIAAFHITPPVFDRLVIKDVELSQPPISNFMYPRINLTFGQPYFEYEASIVGHPVNNPSETISCFTLGNPHYQAFSARCPQTFVAYNQYYIEANVTYHGQALPPMRSPVFTAGTQDAVNLSIPFPTQ